jgi:DNA invertase Pin-like site-specific DNA recombinase
MNTSTAVVYMRASTHNQDFQMQEETLKNAFPELADAEVVWHSDIASGKRESRPGYDKIKDGIERGKIKLVYIYSFDRLARSIKELLSFVELCRDRNVLIKCAKTPLDLTGIAGKIVITVLALTAEIEHEMIYRRLSDGIRRKMMREGYRCGGHPQGWFSKKVLSKVKLIYDLKANGYSNREISRQTGICQRTIANVLKAKREDLIEASEARKLRPVRYKSESNPNAFLKQ